MSAEDLTKVIEFLENERATDLLEYQNHIFLIRERLIPQDYLKVKNKLKPQFKPWSSQKKEKKTYIEIEVKPYLKTSEKSEALRLHNIVSVIRSITIIFLKQIIYMVRKII